MVHALRAYCCECCHFCSVTHHNPGIGLVVGISRGALPGLLRLLSWRGIERAGASDDLRRYSREEASEPVMNSFNSEASPDVWLTWGRTGSGADLEESTTSGQWQPATYTSYYSGNKVTGLTQNTAYQFRVRVCDAFTCGPYSNTVDATSNAGVSDQVSFYLDSVTPANQIPGATATLAGGSFSATAVTIPSKTPAGQHTLYAAIGGGWSQASASLKVVTAGDNLPPVIQVTDDRGNVITRISNSATATVQRSHFIEGHPVTISLDKAGG